jgi:hypothetical protein
MKLLENVSSERHLRTRGRTGVTKLIVAFRIAIALSRPRDSNSSLQEIILFFKFTFSSKDDGWVLLSPDISL